MVNDSRGFFTSRVIGTFLNEGVAMVAEGVDPQSIEQAASQAGYPAPVLQLMDELTLTLPRKIRERGPRRGRRSAYVRAPGRGGASTGWSTSSAARAAAAAPGSTSTPTARARGSGPGCGEPSGATNHDVDRARDMQERMLFAEALETVECLDEGVLTGGADANIGSIFGIGFPAWTGGVLQYIEGYPGGVAGFVARADELAERYGERFRVPASLRARAAA